MLASALCLSRRAAARASSIGPDTSPSYAAPAYDPSGAAIPKNALDAIEFPSLPAWFEAMAAQQRPGKIRSGTYNAEAVGRRSLNTSVYGYGPTRPILRSTAAPFTLYFSADDIVVQYLRFETQAMALAYVDRGAGLIVKGDWHSADLEGSDREGSRARAHDADISGVQILDCEFVCPLPIAFMSGYHRVSDIHIARNAALPGCAGFAHIRSDRFSRIYIYQNDVRGLSQNVGRGNHVGTIIWVGSGVDNSPHYSSNAGVYVENNRIEDVTAARTDRDYNSGVAIDIRESSQAVIRGNVIRNVVNTAGHVDSNGVYAKSSILLEANLIENCGARASDSKARERGSEGSLVTLKGGSRCITHIRDNIFVAGTRTDVPMILVSHRAIIERNRFSGWLYDGDNLKRDAMIRSYSGGPITIVDPTFDECGTAPGNAHRGFAVSGKPYEGGNIAARDFMVSFDGRRTDIFQGDVAAIRCFNARGRPLTVGYAAEVESVAKTAKRPPPQKQKVVMDAFVRDLKFHGIWSRLRALMIFHAADQNMADVDWRDDHRRILSEGHPRFTSYAGYTAVTDKDRLFLPLALGVRGVPGNNSAFLIARVDHGVSIDKSSRSDKPIIDAFNTASDGKITYFKDGRRTDSSATGTFATPRGHVEILSRHGGLPSSGLIWAFAAGLSLNEDQHRALAASLLRYRSAFRP